MIVFTDILTGDQVLSDSFKQEPLKFKDAVLEGVVTVQSALINKELGEINIGANASAEEADEGTDDAAKKVNNLVDADTGFGYQGPMSLSAPEFTALFKKWCKDTKEKIVADGGKPKDFVQTATGFVPFMSAEFKNFELYKTKSFGDTLVIGWWDDEANTVGAPKFIFFSHAMKAEKY
jgi:hypothetical protein